MNMFRGLLFFVCLLVLGIDVAQGFSVRPSISSQSFTSPLTHDTSSRNLSSMSTTALNVWGKPNNSKKSDPLKSEISNKRKKQLGIVDEREYDLELALETNTDPLITKIIAGSFILVVIGLLVAGIVVPTLTDYGDGVCNPVRTGGRC